MITQGVLPFRYEVERTACGMTALAGLPAYLDGDGERSMGLTSAPYEGMGGAEAGMDRQTSSNGAGAAQSGWWRLCR